MSKKSTPTNPSKAKNAQKETVSKKKVGRPRKDTSSTPKPAKKKNTAKSKVSKVKDNEKKVPKKRGRKPKSEASSEVEVKVREIVNKVKAKGLQIEEKKESLTFSLDDVRSILEKRKKESKAKKTEKAKEELESKSSKPLPKKKGRATKVKKIQTASINDILGFGGTVEPTRPIRDEAKVPKEWRSYYNDLMSLRNGLKGALGERSNETLGASAREASGELSINSSDSGTEAFNRDVALSMVASEQEALEEIEDAIDRIFDGTFGVCQETNKPIKKARLKVVPFTRFSLEGQAQYEQRKRKDRDFGGGVFATISDSTMGQDD
jgi:RNA polymerase-binding transcription factor DksA